MAKKYESEIDPDEFIRSFREESSSLSTLKRKPKEAQTQEPEPETKKFLRPNLYRNPNLM